MPTDTLEPSACACCEASTEPSELDPRGACHDCEAYAPCSSCSDWTDDSDDEGACTDCSTRRPCVNCEGWHESDELAPDDRCADCTDYSECEYCGWTRESMAPDDRCLECTSLHSCNGCDEWVEYIDEDGHCEGCSEGSESDEPAVETRPAPEGSEPSSPDARALYMLGVELEGGWHRRPPDYEECFRSDPSVHVRGDWRGGEMASPPFHARAWDSVVGWLRDNYPDRVGRSCGMHVHFSFSPDKELTRLVLEELRTERFNKYVLARLNRWRLRHCPNATWIADRLAGHNGFCQTTLQGDGDRYHALNFNAWHRHGTLEVRVLPMFRDQALALGAVRELVRIIDRGARRTARRIVRAPLAAGRRTARDERIRVEHANGLEDERRELAAHCDSAERALPTIGSGCATGTHLFHARRRALRGRYEARWHARLEALRAELEHALDVSAAAHELEALIEQVAARAAAESELQTTTT